jgi:hypothetical protein
MTELLVNVDELSVNSTELSVNAAEFCFLVKLLFLSHVKHDSTKF